MLSVFRIFQLILGIIVSVTILYFLIDYASHYKETQENLQRGEILKAFADEARDVYLTGISTNFTYFSRYDFSSCYVGAEGKNLPEMECPASNAPNIPVDTPVLFYPGKVVYVGRDTLDYGWWVFNIVEAMPDTVFVFNPLQGTSDELAVMKNIVEHIPDTSDEWSVVKISFAFCDGDISYVCGGNQPCSKGEFLQILYNSNSASATSLCTASLKKNMKLITISTSCNQYLAESGVCINPYVSHGVGSAYIRGSGKTYFWKDPLDLVSLSMGGSEKDEFGKTMGEKIYNYKNSVLMGRLSLASDIMSKRSQLIANDVPAECGPVYIQLSQVLDKVSGKDYQNLSDMYDLNDNLNQAKNLYQQLVDKGCERENYGT